MVVQKRDSWGCGVASSYPRQRRSSPNNAYQLTVADPIRLQDLSNSEIRVLTTVDQQIFPN